MLLCMLFVNDKRCAVSCIASFAMPLFFKSFEAGWSINQLWYYVYSILPAIVLSCLLSTTIFRDPEAAKKAYPYSLKGANEAMLGPKDETGYEIHPLKFDRYFVAPIVIFTALIVFPAIIQSF